MVTRRRCLVPRVPCRIITACLLSLTLFVGLLPQYRASGEAWQPGTAPAALSQSAEEANPRPRVVAILPGHGGKDSGAVHYNAAGKVDLVERDINLAIARKLAARLKAAGYVPVLTREGDDSLTPNPGDAMREVQANLDVANSSNADILVAIHNNGFSDPSFSGTTTYYCPNREFASENLRLARALQKHMVSGFRDVMGYETRDYGVQSANYKPYGCLYTLGDDRGGTFRASKMPGALVEALFVTNDFEAWVLAQDGGQELIAAAILDGIQEYFDSAPISAR